MEMIRHEAVRNYFERFRIGGVPKLLHWRHDGGGRGE
jgi:hypothetical protein